MARGKANREAGRSLRNPSGQDGLFEKSREEAAEAARGRPVECLGLTFENDAARCAHFLGELKKGLEELHATLAGVPFSGIDDTIARLAAVAHWPMGDEGRLRSLAERMARADSSKDLLQRWKDETGFPHGEIEDLLSLSDPPWHTACPNPFLGAFVEAHGRPCDPAEPYRRKPFAVDVSEGKTHPVYRAHGYHTKVPHLAIVPSILHYTEPGDLVLDGFAGSGMTGVAAQWCGTAPESWRKSLEALWSGEGFGKPRWGARYAILNDLSPAAGFIAANYTLPFDVVAFADAGRALLDEVEEELGWMYETLHSDGKTRGRIDYTVWSEVFSCPECASEIVFLEEALDRASGRVSDVFACPDCDSLLNKNNLERVFQSDMDADTGQLWKHVTFRPALIRYKVDGRRFTKTPDAGDRDVLRRIEETPLSMEVPTIRIPIESMYHGSRLAPKGVTHAHHFFLPRAAHALAAMWRKADAHPDSRVRHMLLYFVEQAIWGMSILNRYQPIQHGRLGGSQVNRQLTGVYYVASQISEVSPRYNLGNKLSRLVKAFDEAGVRRTSSCIATASTTASLGIPDDSIDYVFTDPPFGENIYYADLNFLVESWHRVLTNAAPEAIVDRFKGKGLPEYQRLMQRCFEEYRRVLKPGRWITVVFHNSRNAVWTAIQEALLAAGFVVADVRTMDKQQGSYRQVTSTAVKQDLVISAYKPNDGLEERFALEKGTEEGAWDFVRTHLGQLPVFVRKGGRVEVVNERQPYLLFDRMVAFHVLRNVTVPLSVGEFLSGPRPALPRTRRHGVPPRSGRRIRREARGGRGRGAARDLRRRRSLRHPVAQAALGPEAAELPGRPPAVHPRDRGLAETREAARAVGDAGAELPVLRRRRRGSEPDPRLPLHQLQGATEPAQGPSGPARQGEGSLVRARPQQGGGRGDAPRPHPAARVRGVPPVSAEEAQALPPRSDAGRFLQGLAGSGLRHDHHGRGEDPGGRPPGGPEAPALVRPSADPHGSDYMTITRLKLERFTAFEALDIKPLPGINVLVGANGTGKTHLMKVAYAACDISKTDIGFAEKIVRVFMPFRGAIGRLVKRRGEGSSCAAHIHRGDRRLGVSFSTRTKAAESATVNDARRWKAAPVESVYIPAKEMLANAPGFRSLYAQREIHFEEAYADILDRAYRPALRGPALGERKRLLTVLQKEIDGKVPREK